MSTESIHKNKFMDKIDYNLIQSKHQALKQSWMDRLKHAWGSFSEEKCSLLDACDSFGLMNLALMAFTEQPSFTFDDIKPIIDRVRLRIYSISDLFTEFTCLKDAIEEFLPTVGVTNKFDQLFIINRFGELFFKLFKVVLSEISEFYEYVIERGGTGFCQTDENKKIVYANKELRRILDEPNPIGKPLLEYFEGDESILIEKVLSGGKDPKPQLQTLGIKRHDGKTVPVHVEISAATMENRPAKGYAHITDISKMTQLHNDVFDRLKMGIIKVNSEMQVTFVNQSLKALLNIENDSSIGKSIYDFVPEDQRNILEQQLHERFVKGQGDEYNVSLRRAGSDATIPVRITAAPEKLEDGTTIRSIGLIRSTIDNRIHKLIEQRRDSQELLDGVMQEIQCVLPFDRVTVALYSSDEKHVRSFFVLSTNGEPVMERRWWEMTPGMLEWAKRSYIESVSDISNFYKKPPFDHLKDDPAIKNILEQFCSFIYYPVFSKGRAVACVCFYSKSMNFYGLKEKYLLEGLPLDSAVLMAIHYEEKKNLEFLLSLSKLISRSGEDMLKIADVIVENIAQHYDWENVSLFNTQKAQRYFHIIGQHTSKEFQISKDYQQPINKGILGKVYETGKPMNIGDVTAKEYEGVYIPTVKATRSELCIPIKSGELFWILNIEDSRLNAFSEDEEKALLRLFEDVSVFLERSMLRTFLDQSLRSTSDAVWVTDNSGYITRANPAAIRLLNTKKEQIIGLHLSQILREPSMAKEIMEKKKVPNVKIGIRTNNGEIVNILLSKFSLQEFFHTNVYIAKDLSSQERLEELQYLGKMYYEISSQTKTPLNLIFGWLNRLTNSHLDDKQSELIDNSIRQLKKIELTYNRLSLYDKNKVDKPSFPFNEVLCSFNELWRIVGDDLPHNELKKIEIKHSESDCLINGDLFQLSFCLETILSYLLRFLPENEIIHIQVKSETSNIEIEILANFPGFSYQDNSDNPKIMASKVLLEMSLGNQIIRDFISNHNGSYSGPNWNREQINFHIKLPICQE